MKDALRRLNALFDAEGSIRALCLLRIVLGLVVLLHFQPFLERMQEGIYYGDVFHDPWVSWLPHPSRDVYFAMLILGCASALMMSLGLFTRPATWVTLAVVAYNFFLSETHFRHNRSFLLAFLVGMSFLDAGRVYSVDAWRRRRARGRGKASASPDPTAPLWPLWLMRTLGVAPYFASGFSKLIDPDWWSGLVTWDRVNRYRGVAEAQGAPPELMEFLASRDFHFVFGKVAIFTELFLFAGLWFRKTRYAAIWVAICFHATIEVSARVQAFSYLAIAGLLIWVVPSERDRELRVRLDRRWGRLLRALVRRLDWLARFRVRETGGEGPTVSLIDRDGRRYEGLRASRYALSRLPVLAFFVLPTLLPGVAWLLDRLGRRSRG